MPSLKSTAVRLDPSRYRDITFENRGSAEPMPAAPAHHIPPALPAHLVQSRVMLSSLPPNATNISVGALTQFYGGRMFPRRQAIQAS